MATINLRHPESEATISFITDIVTFGEIDYSFIDRTEGVKVDFEYLCTRLGSEAMTDLTDKIKDLITDALIEIDEENYDDDEED